MNFYHYICDYITEMKNTEKIKYLMSTLKHTVNEIPNDWTNKERENFIFQRILTLPFMLNGDFLKKDKGIIKQIKKVYKSPIKSTRRVINCHRHIFKSEI